MSAEQQVILAAEASAASARVGNAARIIQGMLLDTPSEISAFTSTEISIALAVLSAQMLRVSLPPEEAPVVGQALADLVLRVALDP